MIKIGDGKSFLQNVEIYKHGCWLWLGGKNSYGYGQYHKDGKRLIAHRYSYERFNGPIPKDLQIDHLCRVRHCVNPEHLQAVSQKENLLRGYGLYAINARKTHCIHGHEFTPENTRISYGTHRNCRECDRAIVARKKEGGYAEDKQRYWEGREENLRKKREFYWKNRDAILKGIRERYHARKSK